MIQTSPDVVTCNVDAAWDVNSRCCGLGIIFSGPVFVNFQSQLSCTRPFVSSALMSEALAVRRAVMTAAFANFKSLLILSDSLDLIKLLNKVESKPALFGIMFDIYHFSTYFDVISFVHVPRLSNCEADSVAKSALALFTVTFVGGE